MNAPLRRLAVVTLLLFTSLLVSTSWVQFVHADAISDGPGNTRQLFAQFGRDRGDIVAGGTAVATSTPVDDRYGFQRTYSAPELYAGITGYYSIILGSSGIEAAEDDVLAGTADALFYRRIQDLLTGRPPEGGVIELTIDPAVQQAAWDALGDQRGAVVALEPSTGRILAMVSKPSYDPNLLASHDLGAVQNAWRSLNDDPGRPLENRAIRGRLYPPGSVFKIVTAAAALESGRFTPDSPIPGPAEFDLPESTSTLPNVDGRACGADDTTTLLDALRISCNTAFAWLGVELGADALRQEAADFGFGQQIDIPLSVTPSTVPDELDAPQTALSAIGQASVIVTPLQVAMLSAAVANDGVLMRPQLVDTVSAPDFSVISRPDPEEFGRAVSPGVADQLTTMMQAVVEDGTGTRAQIDGVAVAGKSGTAQTGRDEPPHAWFTSFAPVDDPRVAVAVIVENGGSLGNEASGGRVAAPIAKAVMETAIASAQAADAGSGS